MEPPFGRGIRPQGRPPFPFVPRGRANQVYRGDAPNFGRGQRGGFGNGVERGRGVTYFDTGSRGGGRGGGGFDGNNRGRGGVTYFDTGSRGRGGGGGFDGSTRGRRGSGTTYFDGGSRGRGDGPPSTYRGRGGGYRGSNPSPRMTAPARQQHRRFPVPFKYILVGVGSGVLADELSKFATRLIDHFNEQYAQNQKRFGDKANGQRMWLSAAEACQTFESMASALEQMGEYSNPMTAECSSIENMPYAPRLIIVVTDDRIYDTSPLHSVDSPITPFSTKRNDFLLHIRLGQVHDVLLSRGGASKTLDDIKFNLYFPHKIHDHSFEPSLDQSVAFNVHIPPMEEERMAELVQITKGSAGGWMQLLQELNDASFAVAQKRLADTKHWTSSDLTKVSHCIHLLGTAVGNVHAENSQIVIEIVENTLHVGLLDRVTDNYLDMVETDLRFDMDSLPPSLVNIHKQHHVFVLNFGRILFFVMDTLTSQYAGVKSSVGTLCMLLMKADRSPSARRHFYTLEMQQLLAQLEAAQKVARQWLSQDADERDEEEKIKKEKLKIKAQFPHDLCAPPNDFRRVDISPSAEEIVNDVRPFLRRNIIKGAYKSTEDYLDTQFRLLREDMVAPLREGIKKFKLAGGLGAHGRRIRSMQVYQGVTVEPPTLHIGCGTMLRRVHFRLRPNQRMGKKMIFGSMVCLSSDGFVKDLYFATVDFREDIANGEIFIAILRGEEIDTRKEYAMVESPAYYEAYRHVLRGLQKLKRGTPMPFDNYLVQCKANEMQRPCYLRDNPSLDFGVVLPTVDGKRVVRNVFDGNSWPSKEELQVDQSQYDAMRHALTSELAIIQGPPGTGKTFIGYQLVKILLDNEQRYNPTGRHPILVTCFTNHALDQFLEGLADFVDARIGSRPDRCSIVRVGGRCQSEALQAYTISAQLQMHTKSIQSSRQLKTVKEDVDRVMKKITHRSKQMCTANEHVVRLNDILEYPGVMTDVALRQLTDEQKFTNWMLGVDLVTKKRQNIPLIPSSTVCTAFALFDFLTQQPWSPLLTFEQKELYSTAAASAVGPSENAMEDAVNYLQAYVLPAVEWAFYNSTPFTPPPIDDSHTVDWPRLADVNGLCVQTAMSVDSAIMLLNWCGNDMATALTMLNLAVDGGPQPMHNEQQFGLNPTEIKRNRDAVVEKREKLENIREYEKEKFEDEATVEGRNREVFYDETKMREALGLAKIDGKGETKDDWTIVNERQTRTQLLSAVAFGVSETDAMPWHDVKAVRDVYSLSRTARWMLYRFWVAKLRKALRKDILILEREYARVKERVSETLQIVNMEVMRKSMVIGMTTTGAAKHQAILQQMKPSIVIMEEAAEVLEAHLITSLTDGCKHLILIGDHQQLRPNPAVHELAVKYNLDISLFERLVNNKFPSQQLHEQHRMRSSISRIFMPHFYARLTDHSSTIDRPAIRGVDVNVAFIDHRVPERHDDDTTSHSNEHEAKWAIALCKYFLQQGYAGERITVLIAYGEQLFMMRNHMRALRAAFPAADKILLRVLDNYQGEENDIVILSLVRSNAENRIGFLKIPNRVCVALSRARDGLYIIGDMQCMVAGQGEDSNMWAEMKSRLEKHGALLTSLPISCQIHGKQQSIGDPDEFAVKAPEGGCHDMCSVRLQCGHKCSKRCHAYDASHDRATCMQPCQKRCPNQTYKHACKKLCYEKCTTCTEVETKSLPCGHQQDAPCCTAVIDVKCGSPCERTIKTCGHPCGLRCFENCAQSKCCVRVQRRLPCGHTVEVECRKEVNSIKCTKSVVKIWPGCQHEVETTCGTDVCVTPCQNPCKVELPDCKHICTGSCGLCRNGRLHIKCPSQCQRILICGHECESACSAACPPCARVCQTKCKHSKCANSGTSTTIGDNANNGAVVMQSERACGQLCPPCVEKCGWACEHHKCTRLCHEPCDRPVCTEKCRRKLPCSPPIGADGASTGNTGEAENHYCVGVCGEKCPTIKVMGGDGNTQMVDLCATCHPEEMAEIREIFLGYEDEEDAKFIQLPECGHIIEMQGLDGFIDSKATPQAAGDDQPDSTEAPLEIVMYACPKCKTTIRSCDRFGALLKQNQTDIEAVKRAIRGVDVAEVQATRDDLVERIAEFGIAQLGYETSSKPTSSKVTRGIHRNRVGGERRTQDRKATATNNAVTGKFVHNLYTVLMTNLQKANVATLTKSKCNVFEAIFGFLRTICECHAEALEMREGTSTTMATPVRIHQLLKRQMPQRMMADGVLQPMRDMAMSELMVLRSCVERRVNDMSPMMVGQMVMELQRARLYVKMCHLLDQHIMNKLDLDDNQRGLMEDYVHGLLDDKAFDAPKQDSMMETLNKVAKDSHFGPSKLEMASIVAAVDGGMRTGHWYKCKCGTPYAIGECGGAMEVGKCIGCGSAIGGTQHRLLPDQERADEAVGLTPMYGRGY